MQIVQINEGDGVYARKDGGRYYKAIVLRVTKKSYYCVHFEVDDSVADDVDVANIMNWWRSTPPLLGHRFKVYRGKDDIVYGRYMGLNTVYTYQVVLKLKKKHRKTYLLFLIIYFIGTIFKRQ